MSGFAEAEAGIRQLHARCSDAVWRKDHDAFADCFTKTGEWRIAGAVLSGRDVIRTAFEQVMIEFRRVLMTFGTPILEVSGDTAVARTYTVEQSAYSNGNAVIAIGNYFERFAREGDRWRFSWRLFQLHYLGPADLSGTFYDNPDFGAPPAMPALDEPTVDHAGLLAKDGG